jgi:hypothetical protein
MQRRHEPRSLLQVVDSSSVGAPAEDDIRRTAGEKSQHLRLQRRPVRDKTGGANPGRAGSGSRCLDRCANNRNAKAAGDQGMASLMNGDGAEQLGAARILGGSLDEKILRTPGSISTSIPACPGSV